MLRKHTNQLLTVAILLRLERRCTDVVGASCYILHGILCVTRSGKPLLLHVSRSLRLLRISQAAAQIPGSPTTVCVRATVLQKLACNMLFCDGALRYNLL